MASLAAAHQLAQEQTDPANAQTFFLYDRSNPTWRCDGGDFEKESFCRTMKIGSDPSDIIADIEGIITMRASETFSR